MWKLLKKMKEHFNRSRWFYLKIEVTWQALKLVRKKRLFIIIYYFFFFFLIFWIFLLVKLEMKK